MSLLSRIAPAITLLVTCCVAATGLLLILRANADERAARIRDVETAMSVAQTSYEGEVGEVIRSTQLLQGLPPMAGIMRARQNGGVDPVDLSTEQQWRERLVVIFTEMLRSHPRYLQVRYIGVADHGRELVRLERTSGEEGVHQVSDDALQEKEHATYFETAIQLQPGEVSLSPIELNREHGEIVTPHVSVFRVSAPVFDDAGELFGFVIINVDARAILANLANAFPDYTAFVVRSDGHFVMHPEGEHSYGFDLGHPASALTDFPRLAAFISGEDDAPHVADDGETLGAVRLQSATANEQTMLTLVVRSTREQIGGGVFLQVIPSLVAFGAMALILGFILVRLVTRPFRELAGAVSTMDSDDRTLQVPQGLTGEARLLANALERSIEVLRAKDRVVASNRELRQFAYLASHDLREPVRTIASYTELLEEDYAELYDDEGKNYLSFIGRSCDRMNTLIEGLLAHSRIGANATSEVVSMLELVAHVVEDLNASIRTADATIEISDELPTLRVFPLEVRLLFQNLLSNALKFTRPDTPIRVHVDAELIDDQWTFSVMDNGVGIAAEHRERIFRVFQRLHSKSEHEGSGIGLAHCQKIVNLHQGRMWVEDAPGGGAKFLFTLRERKAK